MDRSEIIVFLTLITAVILFLAAFIITLVYLYKKRQISYQQKMESLRINYEKNLMSTQLEIQESTFQNISREIHDNISLSLTLAKLNLNTFDWQNKARATAQLESSVNLLGRAITDLSDISKSLNSESITSQGLINVLEKEIERIRFTNLFTINFNVTGEPVYLETQKDLVVFRVMQEAFNNIIKHSHASYISLNLHYSHDNLHISISDNGRGFSYLENEEISNRRVGSGLKNMEARTKMIGGTMEIKSFVEAGTFLKFNIPI
jgi:two-component system, NarL family, sensor kinase